MSWRVTKPDQPGPDCMWRINRPDLGLVGDGYTLEVITRNVANYRKANGIPIGLGFEQELVNALCEQYHDRYPGACTQDDPNAPPLPRKLRFKDVVVGTKVMLSFWAAGKPVVDRAEAERRAAICVQCPLNVLFSLPCGGICGELQEAVISIVGKHGTTKDDQLRSCGVCACYLSAAVWVPLDIQWPPLAPEQKRQFLAIEHCWKKGPL